MVCLLAFSQVTKMTGKEELNPPPNIFAIDIMAKYKGLSSGLYRLQQNYRIVFTCKPPDIPNINQPIKTKLKLMLIKLRDRQPKNPKKIASLIRLVNPSF